MDIYEHILTNGGEPYATYIVDVETTQRAPKPLFSADPFYNKNLILQVGTLYSKTGLILESVPPNHAIKYLNTQQQTAKNVGKFILLVGHNFKFDLHYLRREGLSTDRVVIFDTLIATYLLANMAVPMPDLEKACEVMAGLCFTTVPKHLKCKLPFVKAMIQEGRIEEVDPIELQAYLEQDLRMTGWLYNAILVYLDGHPEKWGLINIQMRAALGVQEMEYNGMPVYMDTLEKIHHKASAQAVTTTQNLLKELPLLIDAQGEDLSELSLDSHKTLNACINGFGTIALTVRRDNGKGRMVNRTLLLEPLTKPKQPEPTSFCESNIQYMLANPPDHFTRRKMRYLELVLELRTQAGIINKFCVPYTAIMEAYGEDWMHPTINQAIARTGRTTSSKPNGQQVMELLRAIFGMEGHYSISADYSQLELCALAHRCGLGRLIEDITNGVDIHGKIGAIVHNRADITKAMRTKIKNIVFGYFYGGGYKTLSEQSGLPIGIVKKVIKTLMDLYPEIKVYYDTVKASMVLNNGLRWDGGIALRSYTYTDTETYRSYHIEESIYEGAASFPYTRSKNYPIQGLATGDWVPMWVALLLTYQRWYDKSSLFHDYKMQLMIHDEVLGRVKTANKGWAHRIGEGIAKIGEELLPELYLRWTGVKIAVPLKVNVLTKATW